MRTSFLLVAFLTCLFGSSAETAELTRTSTIGFFLDSLFNPNQTELDSYKADYDRICHSPASIEEADLCQQWRSAELSEQNLYFNKVQLYSTIVGSFCIVITIVLSFYSTLISRQSLYFSKRSSQLQIRSYIAIRKPTIFSFDATFPCTFEFNIENVGQTPARILRWGWKLEVLDDQVFVPDFTSIYTSIDLNTTIAQSGSVNMHSGDTAISIDDIDQINKGSARIFVHGYIEFVDIFDELRRYYFSYKLIPESEDAKKLTSRYQGEFKVRWVYVGILNGEKEAPFAR